MAPGGERPELEALNELEQVLRHIEGELASWRRRALQAEARLSDVEAAGSPEAADRARELEAANQALGERVELAKGRVSALMDRLRFLEQQRVNGEGDR